MVEIKLQLRVRLLANFACQFGNLNSLRRSTLQTITNFIDRGDRSGPSVQAISIRFAATTSAEVRPDGSSRFTSPSRVLKVLTVPLFTMQFAPDGAEYPERYPSTKDATVACSFWRASSNTSWRRKTTGVRNVRKRMSSSCLRARAIVPNSYNVFL